jgi:hypothetical protein
MEGWRRADQRMQNSLMMFYPMFHDEPQAVESAVTNAYCRKATHCAARLAASSDEPCQHGNRHAGIATSP